jgi:hypothetical protein
LEEPAAAESERDYVAELATCRQPLIVELPEMYRSTLMLSEIEELPQKEGAGGCSIAARLKSVKTKLSVTPLTRKSIIAIEVEKRCILLIRSPS